MDTNQHRFAMFVDVQGLNTLIVGGGPVALRKTRRLVEAGAKVTVIAPKHHAAFDELVSTTSLTLKMREFTESDVEHMGIVVAATDSVSLNREIAKHAKIAGAQVNVANDPAAGSFIMPSLIDRTPILIAISSGGASPVLSRLLTVRIEAFIPKSFANLATLAGNYRQANRVDGEVYLVGAGPGDPDLLSFRALRLMQHVDVVFYDRLVSDAVLSLVKPDATRIYVGKQRSNHEMPQETINQQLVDHAILGKRVLRLKGGDPFILSLFVCNRALKRQQHQSKLGRTCTTKTNGCHLHGTGWFRKNCGQSNRS